MQCNQMIDGQYRKDSKNRERACLLIGPVGFLVHDMSLRSVRGSTRRQEDKAHKEASRVPGDLDVGEELLPKQETLVHM